MADRLLWDNGDGILLEDSSGDIALEFDSPSLIPLSNPQQAAYIRIPSNFQQNVGGMCTAVLAALSFVAPAVLTPKAFAYASNAYAREYVQRQPQGGLTNAVIASLPVVSVPFVPPKPVRPLQFRSSFSYQITRSVGQWVQTPQFYFPFPSAARQLQTRTGWNLQVIRQMGATGVPPQPFVPPNPVRKLQHRQGWQSYLTRTFGATPIPPVIDTTAIPMEEPIGEFWDLPPYPRQQPRTYMATLRGSGSAQFQATLYGTPSASLTLTNAIRMVCNSSNVRSFTPAVLSSTILLASAPYETASLNPALSTGIAMAAVLGDVRHLAVIGFQPQFSATMLARSQWNAALSTGIPLAAQLAAVSNAVAPLSATIQFAATGAAIASLNVPLSTVPTFSANMTMVARAGGSLATGIPLGATLVANATGSAALATNIPLLAALAVQAQSTPNLASGITLAAAVGNLASFSTSLLSSLPAQMVAAMVAGAAATPTLGTGINLGTSSMRDVRHVTAALTTLIPFATSAADKVALSAVLSTAVSLGTVPGADAAQLVGALTNAPRFAANPAGQARLQAAITQLIRFASTSTQCRVLLQGALTQALGPTLSATDQIVYAQAPVRKVIAPQMLVYAEPTD